MTTTSCAHIEGKELCLHFRASLRLRLKCFYERNMTVHTWLSGIAISSSLAVNYYYFFSLYLFILHSFINSFTSFFLSFVFFVLLQGLQVTIYDIYELLNLQLSSSILYPVFAKNTGPATKGNGFLNRILQFM